MDQTASNANIIITAHGDMACSHVAEEAEGDELGWTCRANLGKVP